MRVERVAASFRRGQDEAQRATAARLDQRPLSRITTSDTGVELPSSV